jgi:hypothetical protein
LPHFKSLLSFKPSFGNGVKTSKSNTMKKANIYFTLVLLVLAASLNSCRKDKEEEEETNGYSEEAVAGYVEKSLSEEEDGLTLKNLGSNTGNCSFGYPSSSCATITEDSPSFPKTITVDFGTGCTDYFGRTRIGKMLIHLTDSFHLSGAIRTVTFENFSINGVGIVGSRITTNTGLNSSGQPTFTRVINTDITSNGSTFSRNFTHQMTWLSGYDTPACFDNVWSISGNGTVVRPNGNTLSRVITSPLIVDFSCQHIKQGTVQITTSFGLWTLDYGNGACDNAATVTRPNGTVNSISL